MVENLQNKTTEKLHFQLNSALLAINFPLNNWNLQITNNLHCQLQQQSNHQLKNWEQLNEFNKLVISYQFNHELKNWEQLDEFNKLVINYQFNHQTC